MKIQVTLFIYLLFLTSCVKDKPSEQLNTQLSLSSSKKVYLVNEGNFNSGNASVSLYDKGTGEVIEDIYKSQNELSLGDVAQSMVFAKGNFYVVVNNSGKIVVCNDQFKKTSQINGLTSPRYFLQATQQKGYVSDFKSNTIHVVDLNSNLETKSIPCPGWTEEMCMIYNKVFVCNQKRNYVYVINSINDKIEDSVFVGLNAGSLKVDTKDKIWVLASGNKPNSVGRLSRIDPINNSVEQFIDFGPNAVPEKLCINKTADTLYFVDGGIFRMSINDLVLPQTAFIPNGNRVYYGLGINPNDYSIYVSDVIDYVQKSQIYIFDAKGSQIKTFKAGIITNGFYFE